MTIATAMAQVLAVFPTVFYAPQWWRTDDGCIAYRALWGWARLAPAAQAFQRLSMSRAVNMGLAHEKVDQQVTEDLNTAFAP